MIISNKQQLSRKEPKRTKSKGGNHGANGATLSLRPNDLKAIYIVICHGLRAKHESRQRT